MSPCMRIWSVGRECTVLPWLHWLGNRADVTQASRRRDRA